MTSILGSPCFPWAFFSTFPCSLCGHRGEAMRLDSLRSSHPIQVPIHRAEEAMGWEPPSILFSHGEIRRFNMRNFIMDIYIKWGSSGESLNFEEGKTLGFPPPKSWRGRHVSALPSCEAVSYSIWGLDSSFIKTGLYNSGWWFQTFFPIIYGIILPIGQYFSKWLKPPTSTIY